MKLKSAPNNPEREQSVLGAMFLNPKIKPMVAGLITQDDFYREAHQNIFNALLNSGSDLVEIVGYLEKKGQLKAAGGSEYVADVFGSVATSAGVKHHCEELKKLSLRRKLIAQCMTTAEACYLHSEDVEDSLEAHKGALREMQQDRSLDYTPTIDLVKSVYAEIEGRAKQKQPSGIKTGFDNLDSRIYGLEPGTVTIIMARPSTGKTALALNIACNVAKHSPGRVLYYNLESSGAALTRRMLACESGVPLSCIRSGQLSDWEWDAITSAANEIASSTMTILEKARYKDIFLLHSMSETMALNGAISLIVIDHFTKLFTSQKTHSSHHQYSIISNKITTIAKELKVPVVLLCQMNREFEKRPGTSRPRLSDLRETGSLEEDADNVLSIFRETKESDVAEIELLKGRDVGTFKTWLSFDRFCQRFNDCAEPSVISTARAFL